MPFLRSTPGSEEWESLPDDEKGAVYAAYKALNETRVHIRRPDAAAGDGDHGAG